MGDAVSRNATCKDLGRHAWRIDPERRTLEACSNHDGHWLPPAAFEHADAVCIPPFDAVRFDLDGLWAD